VANVTGTILNDFIHRLGDGLTPPAGYSEVTGVTTGDDSVNGSIGNDIIYGDAGNDTLNGGSGSDTLNGGADNDTYIVDATGDTVIEAAGGGIDTVRSSVSFTLGAEVERLILTGSSFINGTGNTLANVITGNSGVNTLDGGDGNDTLYGGSNVDAVFGGAGNDILNGGTGSDTMTGGADDDTYVVDAAGDSVVEAAGGGIDTVQSSISYALGTEVENLTLTGSAASGTGNALANVITGNSSANTLDGGDGNDTLDGSSGVDVVYGGTGNDTLYGGSSVDAVFGGAGNDTLDGGTGADTMNGGADDDIYVVDSSDSVVEAAGGGVDTVLSSTHHTLGAEVENLILTGASAIRGFGNTLANVITGNNGANTLDGAGGDDTLYGGAGIDRMVGGTGADMMSGGADNDTYIVDNAGDTVIETAGGGIDTVQSSVSYALASDVENLTLTGSSGISGTGNTLANVIIGNTGANNLDGGGGDDTLDGSSGVDTMFGGIGNDRLIGGSGADTMSGGADDDTYVVDNAGDTVIEAAGGGVDTVQSSVNYTLGAEVEHLTLTGAGGVGGTGNALANIITGNTGANRIVGGLGADTITAGAGNDTLVVSTASEIAVGEVYDGGAGDGDRLDGSTIATPVDLSGVTLAGLEIINGFFDGLTLTAAQLDAFTGIVNTGPITLSGAGSADLSDADVFTGVFQLSNAGNGLVLGDGGAAFHVVNGGSGADTITTGSGNDQIVGGLGADTISAGAGNDILTVTADSEAVAGEVYDGGAGTGDRLEAATVDGPVDLSGSTVAGLEIINGFFDGLTLTAAQLDAFTGFVNTGPITLSGAGSAELSDADVFTGVFQLSNAGNGLVLGDGGAAFHVVNGGSGADTITTGSGNDQIVGGLGVDTINGGAGNDTLTVTTDDEAVAGEVYDGGAGDGDRLEAATVGGPVDLSGSTVAGLEIINGFFNGLTLTAAQLDGFTGFVNTGAITLSGAGSADLSDADVFTGVFQLSNAGNGLTLGDGGAAFHVVNGGSGADTVTTGSGNDQIVGGLGADAISAGAGNDTLTVNTDDEAVAGEVYDGGAGDGDRLEGATVDGPVDLSGVTLTGLEIINGFFDGLTLTVAQLDAFTGFVNTGAITLSGAGSADLSDAAIFTGAFQLSNAGNGLTLADGGAAFYIVNGGSGADTITTASGTDTIVGGLGADTITGGAGNDQLSGGDGADWFGYTGAGNGIDTIADFSGQTDFGGGAGEGDLLVFDDVLVGTFEYRGSQAFTGTGNTEARAAGGQVFLDGNGDGAADIIIALNGLTDADQLVAADFAFL
jgi:Ca2+-binding RTX toxin-like protein